MQATFNGSRDNAKEFDNTKEQIDSFDVVAVNPQSGDLERVVIVRFYAARSHTGKNAYCSIWVHKSGLGTSGYGVSADPINRNGSAFARALHSAGIEYIDHTKDGVHVDLSAATREGMRNALGLIADALGYEKYIVI